MCAVCAVGARVSDKQPTPRAPCDGSNCTHVSLSGFWRRCKWGGGAIRREPGRFRAGRQIKGDAPTSAPGPLRSLESADLRPGKGPEEALARALFLFCRFPDPGKGGSRK